MKSLVILICTVALLSAETVDSLIQKALANHPSLGLLKAKIETVKSDAELRTFWQNPRLTFNINDLRFDDFLARDLEPMQFQAVIVNQTIPTADKLTLDSERVLLSTEIIKHTITGMESRLAGMIRKSAYEVMGIGEELAILRRFEETERQILELLKAYEEAGLSKQLPAVRAEIALSNLALEVTRLEKKRERLFAVLSEQTATDIASVESSLTLHDLMPLSVYTQKMREHNPSLLALDAEKEVAYKNTDLAEAKGIPDVTLGVGYYNRQEFEDYLSITASLSLPIYGKEEEAVVKSKRAASEVDWKRKEAENRLTYALERLYLDASEAHARHRIITEQVLSQTEYGLDVLLGQIESGSARPEQALSLISELLKTERMAVREKVRFNTALAEIGILTGEIQ